MSKLIKRTFLFSILKAMYHKFCEIRRTIVMFMSQIWQIKSNKVIFVSFNGKNYADNPRAISEELQRSKEDVNIVWAYSNKPNKNIPTQIKQVKFDSFAYLYHLSTAKVWVNNGNLLKGTLKRKKQVYIQTWHGDRVPKKVLYDALELDSYNSRHRNMKLLEERYCDLCIAGSDMGERVYRTAFRYKGEVLKTGSPRNDILVNYDEEKADVVREKLCLDKQYKYLLFAPTFRDNLSDKQNMAVDISELLNNLELKGMKWKCLLRAHVGSAGIIFDESDKRIINVTKYDDIADLMLISDILVTDYSSCCGDFILLNRPVILCHFDKEDYQTNCRQFNFDFEKSGYLIAQNQSQLQEIVDKLDEIDIKENCQHILEFFGTNETGRASRDVVEYILHKMVE